MGPIFIVAVDDMQGRETMEIASITIIVMPKESFQLQPREYIRR
jgi:hypothetical protein